MNDQELITAWQQMSIDRERIQIQSPNLTKTMNREMKKFERRISNRDRTEIFSALGLMVFLTAVALASEGASRVGSLLLIGYCLWIIYYLTRARNRQPKLDLTQSVKEQLNAYYSYVILQRNLVKNLLYWYILPLLPGMLVFLLTMESWWAIAAAALLNILLLSYIYRRNQRAAQENYEVLIIELEDAIASLS